MRNEAGTKFSASAESTILRALELAKECRHEYLTLEHLLVALTEDDTAKAAMCAGGVDIEKVRADTNAYLKVELDSIVVPKGKAVSPKPTLGLQRVLQRAMVHSQSIAADAEVYGDEVLIALLSERGSHAVFFLQEQDITRYDVLPYVTQARLQRAQAIVPPIRQDPPVDSTELRPKRRPRA